MKPFILISAMLAIIMFSIGQGVSGINSNEAIGLTKFKFKIHILSNTNFLSCYSRIQRIVAPPCLLELDKPTLKLMIVRIALLPILYCVLLQ